MQNPVRFFAAALRCRLETGKGMSGAPKRTIGLLLSKDAEAHSRPELEIYQEVNIQCSHGATVGQLDEAALFYLRARGIAQNPEAETHYSVRHFLPIFLERVPASLQFLGVSKKLGYTHES